MEEQIRQAVEVLKKGGIILYPTDTIWGIGCDATLSDAVSAIYRIKRRDESKSMLVLSDSIDRLYLYVEEVPETALRIMRDAVSPVTIIYPKGRNLAPNLLADDGSIGIRVTTDLFCCHLIRTLGKPVVSTSANVSGEPGPLNFSEISAVVKNSVDFIVDWRREETKQPGPSLVIRVGLNGEVEIIRNSHPPV